MAPSVSDITDKVRNGAETPAGRDVAMVLVAEGPRRPLGSLRRCLEPRYQVITASNGADALALARVEVPDLIVSEVVLSPAVDRPDAPKDGLELCRSVRRDPDLDVLPVILVSSLASIEDRLRGLRTGADDYQLRPFDDRELTARIDNLISLRRRLRQRFGSSDVGHPQISLPLADGVTPSHRDLLWLERVQREIAAGFADEDFSVEMLAGRLAVHRSRLHERLRYLTGLPPVRLIVRWRLTRAAGLLEDDLCSVTEAAYAVGFGSLEHFSRSFRKQFGQAPSAYRRVMTERVAPTSQARLPPD